MRPDQRPLYSERQSIAKTGLVRRFIHWRLRWVYYALDARPRKAWGWYRRHLMP